MTKRPSIVEPARSSDVSTAAPGGWHQDDIVEAVRVMGWRGEIRWPVDFDDLTFAAVCSGERVSGPGMGWLVGCVVPSSDQTLAVQDASQLAGYSARAVLVADPGDVIDLQLQTSLLDQGAVVKSDRHVVAVNPPGDVVPSPLQLDDAWKVDRRWSELQHAVLSSPVVGTA